MFSRTYRTVALFLAFAAASHAGDAPKMLSRVIRVPPATLKEEGHLKPLPPCADGEARYDLREYLEMRGIVFTPECSAIMLGKNGVAVVRGSAEMVELSDYVLRPLADYTFREAVIAVRLWEYVETQPPAPGRQLNTLVELKKEAGDLLRLADSVTGVCELNQRATIPIASKASQEGFQGRFVEIEPVFDKEQNQLGVSIGYDWRFPQEGPPKEGWVCTSVVDGQERVAHLRRNAVNGKVIVRALTVAVQMLAPVEPAQGLPPPLTADEIERLIRRAEER